jgi:hypothetical protein
MAPQDSLTTGDRVRQVNRTPIAVEPGTLLHKPIPPRMVEPYLTGRRSIIAGFVHRVADSSFGHPADYYHAMSLGYEGSEFTPDMEELYLLRWRAVGSESYQVPYSVPLGGDWAMKPPFTGTGYTAGPAHPLPEFFTDPIPVPVGAEIVRICAGRADFIARYDGQVWLRPSGGI